MKKYKLKNGCFVAISCAGSHHFSAMDDTEIADFFGQKVDVSKAIGYLRFGSIMIQYFTHKNMNIHLSIKNAYDEIKKQGWDDDLHGSLVFMKSGTIEDINISIDFMREELKKDPVCDCGGVKCKLPCYHWCSTRRQ